MDCHMMCNSSNELSCSLYEGMTLAFTGMRASCICTVITILLMQALVCCRLSV